MLLKELQIKQNWKANKVFTISFRFFKDTPEALAVSTAEGANLANNVVQLFGLDLTEFLKELKKDNLFLMQQQNLLKVIIKAQKSLSES